MFPGSQIAQKMRLGPSKLKYMVNHGIAPNEKEDILKDDVRKSDWYVVSFDESMNDITQTSEMDICWAFGMMKRTKWRIGIGIQNS